MAYIGKTPIIGNFQVCDAISTVNGQAAYTLQVGGVNVSPETVNNMIVSVNGVIQKPTASYTVSGSTITFTSNLVTGDVIDFIQILGSVLDLGTPSDNTVTTAKIADSAVTAAKLASGVGGSLVKLAAVSVDNAASAVSFDGYFTSDYKNYIVYFNDVFSSSDSSQAYVRVRQSNADKTDSKYRFVSNFATRTASANNWYTNQGAWDDGAGGRITGDTLGDTAAEAGQGCFTIFNPLSTTQDKRIIGDFIYMRASDNELIKNHLQMEYNDTGALSGITFYLSTGNITANLTLYGITN